MYAEFLKRFFDFWLALIALIVLSPILLVLTFIGAIAMKGNPFFTQKRPGKSERIFRLIKFRTMTNEKNEYGEFLPDEKRLIPYGNFLRRTSLDELPEILNIVKGDLAIVGPRPLLVKYIPLYNEEQHHRHDVRPGLTGYAQVHGRNMITWEEKFKLDVEYVRNITFWGDVKIILGTVKAVLKCEGISHEGNATMEEFFGTQESAAMTDAADMSTAIIEESRDCK